MNIILEMIFGIFETHFFWKRYLLFLDKYDSKSDFWKLLLETDILGEQEILIGEMSLF